jgi:putative ABC transport system permease protein
LSISGLYGVLTYTFGQRIREIGIRIALGASPPDVTRLVVVRLDNVSVIDLGAFAVSVALVVGAVALASYGPARRAARVEPSLMLRADA